jgi:hypothetical protein
VIAALLGPKPTPSPSAPPGPYRLSFVTHAAFFSLETRQPTLVDPQMFVADPAAPAALGLQQIEHLTGLRSAQMDDDPTAPALDANGQKLGFDLQHWFSANGVVQVDPYDADHASQRVIARFANLVPRGRYSLFLKLDAKPPVFVPLDAAGHANSFTAGEDGAGGLSVTSPRALNHGDAIILVYHADHVDHGKQRGGIGLDAFHQLIVSLP